MIFFSVLILFIIWMLVQLQLGRKIKLEFISTSLLNLGLGSRMIETYKAIPDFMQKLI